MNRLVAWVKEHPYETGALALVVGVAAYLLLRGGGGSTAQSAASSAPAADYYQAQLQAMQLSAAATAQQTQAAVQTNHDNLQAQLANNELTAQLSALQVQDGAAIQAAQIQADLQKNITQVQANASVQQTQIQADVINNQTAAQVQSNKDNLDAVLGLVSTQAEVQKAQYQYQFETQQANDYTALGLSEQQYNYLAHEVDAATTINLTQLQDATMLEEHQQTIAQNTINALTANKGLSRNNVQLAEVLSTIDAALGQSAASSTLAQASTGVPTNNAGATAASITQSGLKALTGLFA